MEENNQNIPNNDEQKNHYKNKPYKNFNSTNTSSNSNLVSSNSIFWGVFLTLTGIFLLLENFDIKLDIYDKNILNLWPLIFIFLGISYFKIPHKLKQLNSFLSAIFILYYLFNLHNYDFNFIDYLKKSKNFNIELNNSKNKKEYSFEHTNDKIYITNPVSKAYLEINSGVGKFDINSIDDENNIDLLLETNSKSNGNNNDKVLSDYDSLNKFYYISYKSEKNNVINDDFEKNVEIVLNKNILWNIESNCGVGEFNYNFSNLLVDTIKFNIGAAELNVKFGKVYKEAVCIINSGAAEINIKIPKEIGCKVVMNSTLSDSNLDEFIKIDKQKYKTNNYDKSIDKLIIHIEGGLSEYNFSFY